MPSPPSSPAYVGRASASATLVALGGAGLVAHELSGSDLQIEVVGAVWLLLPWVVAPLLVWLWRLPPPSWLSCGLALTGCVLAGLESQPAWGCAAITAGALRWATQPAPAPAPRSARVLAPGLLLAGLAVTVAALARDPRTLLACLPLLIAAGYDARGPRTLQRSSLRAWLGWVLVGAAGVAWVRAAWSPGWFLTLFVLAALPLRLGRGRPPFRRHPIPWACAEYTAWICLPLVLWSLHAGGPAPRVVAPSMVGYLPQRLAHYAEHREEFDLVFVGDSRTYCGIHPALLDPLLDARSINLAVPAHWLPTQYPFMRDLIAQLPPGTTVVLSVGALNFQPIGDTIQTGYPLSWGEAWEYLTFGFGFTALRPNLVENSSLGPALAPLTKTATQLRAACDAFVARPLTTSPPAPTPGLPPPEPGDPFAARAKALLARLSADPTVADTNVLVRNGRTTAVEAYGTAGGTRFFELDRAYFRERQVQREDASARFSPDLPRLRLFERLLDVCQEAGVHLVVNAIGEAPHTYTRERFRLEAEFMDQEIRPRVESRGFAYVEVDFSGITDAHYLDYNHLNQDGVALYAPRLAEALRPHLRRD